MLVSRRIESWFPLLVVLVGLPPRFSLGSEDPLMASSCLSLLTPSHDPLFIQKYYRLLFLLLCGSADFFLSLFFFVRRNPPVEADANHVK